jgi:hypothetical protein
MLGGVPSLSAPNPTGIRSEATVLRIATTLGRSWKEGGGLAPAGFPARASRAGDHERWFFAAFGMRISLWAKSRKQATERVMLPAVVHPSIGYVLPFLPAGRASVLLGAASDPFLLLASMLSYDDIAAALGPGTFPQLALVNIRTGEWAWRVLATILIGVTLHAVGAAFLTQRSARRFDEAVGRPMRQKGGLVVDR